MELVFGDDLSFANLHVNLYVESISAIKLLTVVMIVMDVFSHFDIPDVFQFMK